VRQLASNQDISGGRLLHGKPHFLGYIASAYQTYGGKKAKPHEYWEKMLPARVKDRIAEPLKRVDSSLVSTSPYKLGDIPNFHSLAAKSQEYALAVGKLRGYVDSGHYPKVDDIRDKFSRLAKDILKKSGK
jgi:hypothetical protein